MRGNDTGWFAFLVGEDTFFLPLYFLLRVRERGYKSISERGIREMGYSFEEWIKEVTG